MPRKRPTQRRQAPPTQRNGPPVVPNPTEDEAQVARQALVRAAAVVAVEQRYVADGINAILRGQEPPAMPAHDAIERPSERSAAALISLAQITPGHTRALSAVAPELLPVIARSTDPDLSGMPPAPARIIVSGPPEIPDAAELRRTAESIRYD